MRWITNSTLFLVAFMIGQAIPSSTAAQRPFGLSEMEVMRLTAESEEKQRIQEQRISDQLKLQDELKKDRAEFQYTYEMALLWMKLAESQDQYMSQKWNEKIENVALRLDIKLIKDELSRREKETKKHLTKK
jgi:hypothetical protein